VRRWIRNSFLVVGGILLLLIASGLVVGCMFAGSVHKGSVTDHFDGKYFKNQDDVPEHGFKDFWKWTTNRDQGPWKRSSTPPEEKAFAKRVATGELKLTFVNHTTFLIQYDGLNVLTDPVWSKRVSPVSFAGPLRFTDPGVRFEDLPPIDVVIVSHNHYDHMDIPTLKQLEETHKPLFLVSLGNRELLVDAGLGSVIEMDWWDERILSNNQSVTYVPATHFSGRGLGDRNRTLWGGFVLQTTGGPVYFAGDTGWGKHFEEVKERFGAPRVSLLPIGAYKPRWFMSPVHISPAEAVEAHLLLDSKVSVASHFGAFALADDGQEEPLEELIRVMAEKNIEDNRFLVLNRGTTLEVQ